MFISVSSCIFLCLFETVSLSDVFQCSGKRVYVYIYSLTSYRLLPLVSSNYSTNKYLKLECTLIQLPLLSFNKFSKRYFEYTEKKPNKTHLNLSLILTTLTHSNTIYDFLNNNSHSIWPTTASI